MASTEFSVIIPLYNKEKVVKQTIESVLKQTISDFELIIINDGSTDRSVEIVNTISDKRIRLISKDNGGVSSARNTGIRESMGKYICFLDADDMWMPDFLETVKNLFLKFPQAGMVCPSYQIAYGGRIVHPKWKSVDLSKDSLVNDFFEMASAPFWICNSSCVAIKATVFGELEQWFSEKETFYEDFELWIRIGERYPVAHSNKICATYQRATDMNARKSHSNKIIFSKNYMSTLDNFLEKESYTEKQKEWLTEIRDRRMVLYIFSLYMTGNRKKAIAELRLWETSDHYKKYALALKLLYVFPQSFILLIQKIRIKVF